MQFSGKEVFFDKDDLIVSKTDLKGKITYANDIFLDIAGYTEAEVLGQPHNVIRHPSMPRAIFELLWRTISKEQELFAYVVNKTKNGDHYWVIAHVTPSYTSGRHVGYHSTRRVPNPATIQDVIEPFYDKLNAIEGAASRRKDGISASLDAVNAMLVERGQSYNEFISGLVRAA